VLHCMLSMRSANRVQSRHLTYTTRSIRRSYLWAVNRCTVYGSVCLRAQVLSNQVYFFFESHIKGLKWSVSFMYQLSWCGNSLVYIHMFGKLVEYIVNCKIKVNQGPVFGLEFCHCNFVISLCWFSVLLSCQ
jgi:hypothetical protein